MAKFPVNASGLLGSNESKDQSEGLSILADGARVIGTVVGSGVFKVEGVVEGSIRAKRQVLVGSTGVVAGDIRTDEATIGGNVNGSIHAEHKVALLDGASCEGDLTAPAFEVEEGASISGRVTTGAPPAEQSHDDQTEKGVVVHDIEPARAVAGGPAVVVRQNKSAV